MTDVFQEIPTPSGRKIHRLTANPHLLGDFLVNEGHRPARRLECGYSIVLGSENYCPAFGCRPAEELGIKAPFEVPREKFMVCRLNDKAESIRGTVVYAEKFGIRAWKPDPCRLSQPLSALFYITASRGGAS